MLLHLTTRARALASRPAFHHAVGLQSFRRLQSTLADAAKAATLVPNHPKAVKDALTVSDQAQMKDLKNADYVLFHPVYTPEELAATSYTHRSVTGVRDSIAYSLVRLMRFGFDYSTGYTDKVGIMTERQWLNRIVFLETVAGVPGMVAGMTRHMRSLRLLKRDYGWIHTLLEEAENERMHLLTFMKLKNPGALFRLTVLFTQGVFFNAYFLCYLLSPMTCHRFVGYLEESAVHTYTLCLNDIEHGRIKHWGTQAAPDIAKFYWRLGEHATVKDVVAAVRADEADHRDTNHILASLKVDEPNPFAK
ncbi:alternative oxidase [Chytriomyces cf. hyalinus JEL632]|nr:alternative oxidase [Chytriomyces cf. hyalinus JEL632]